MKGTIRKIHPLKNSRNGNAFLRVEFKLENGTWAKTDLCPNFRNYSRWENLLKVGNILSNLTQRSNKEINADSYPKLVMPEQPKFRYEYDKKRNTMVMIQEVFKPTDLTEPNAGVQAKLL